MDCFQHPGRDANAICQHCGKATCSECCEDTGQGIACSTRCANEIRQAQLLASRLRESFGVGRKPPMPATVPTYFFFGLILLLTSAYIYFSEARIDYLTLAMAAVFFVMAAGSYKRYRDMCISC